MFGHTDRTHTRTATAVRRSECLVQVEVAHVCTDESWVGEPHLRIHVGTVHIYLRAAGMDDAANFLDFRFEDTVCRRIGNHQRSQVVFVLFGFGPQIVHVYIAMFIAVTGHRGESCLNS